MSTEIIILAQGTQQRLGMLRGYKQLLGLPSCGNTPIMARTVGQVYCLTQTWPSIVSWPDMRGRADVKLTRQGTEWTVMPSYHSLETPGNSSLKGIDRYLRSRTRRFDRTWVLLGDVVYSWACLEAISKVSERFGFVGTSDLSNGGGELWGVGWHHTVERQMLRGLEDGLLRHPPFEDEYQPGQMRRWISGWRRGDLRHHVAQYQVEGHYLPIDDYTHDIDLPGHVAMLPELSVSAASDDAQHGVVWTYCPRRSP
jgi:hypothetical protein